MLLSPRTIPIESGLKKQVEEYRTEARTKFGREIQIWMSAYVVLKDTMDEAKAYAHGETVTQGDDAPVQNIIANNAIDTKTMPTEAVCETGL